MLSAVPTQIPVFENALIFNSSEHPPWQPFPSRSHHWAPAEVQEPISGGIIKLGAQVFVGCLQNRCTSLHSNGHVKCIYLSTKNLGWACFDVTKSDTMWYTPLESCDKHIEWCREFIFLVAAHLPTTSCHLRSSFCVTAHCSTHFYLSNLFSSWKTTIGTLPWAMRFTVERSSEMSKLGFWSMALCEVSFRKGIDYIPKPRWPRFIWHTSALLGPLNPSNLLENFSTGCRWGTSPCFGGGTMSQTCGGFLGFYIYFSKSLGPEYG